MKGVGWSVLIAVCLFFLVTAVFMNSIFVLALLALYSGMLCYTLLRENRNNSILAARQIIVTGAILTGLLIIETPSLQWLIRKVPLSEVGSYPLLDVFGTGSFLSAIIVGVLFSGLPFLAAYLEGLTEPDKEGLKRNLWLMLLYVIITLSFYEIYWLWQIKKSLALRNIITPSLWWILVPFVGLIMIYIGYAKALERRTKRKFSTWFLIFFFFRGLDVVIIQALINKDVQ